MNRTILAIAAALCVAAGPLRALADDVECPEDKVKTCFMDGGQETSCICVEPSENRDDPVLPANEDSPNPSSYESSEG
ncbi:MAG: hypothetical protein K1X83_09325 [Oligoflexia bacterium]|nr:hypothetical protein [Oligoflexia bacterium]